MADPLSLIEASPGLSMAITTCSRDPSADPSTLSSQTPASAQCIRMVLNAAGIAAGWQVEFMPQARVMLDAILLPDGRVLIVNGAQTGMAGYGTVGDDVGTGVGIQAADHFNRFQIRLVNRTRTIRPFSLSSTTPMRPRVVGFRKRTFRRRLSRVYTIRLRLLHRMGPS